MMRMIQRGACERITNRKTSYAEGNQGYAQERMGFRRSSKSWGIMHSHMNPSNWFPLGRTEDLVQVSTAFRLTIWWGLEMGPRTENLKIQLREMLSRMSLQLTWEDPQVYKKQREAEMAKLRVFRAPQTLNSCFYNFHWSLAYKINARSSQEADYSFHLDLSDSIWQDISVCVCAAFWKFQAITSSSTWVHEGDLSVLMFVWDHDLNSIER